MSIEFVIALVVVSSVGWAGVSYLCYRCGLIEGALGTERGASVVRNADGDSLEFFATAETAESYYGKRIGPGITVYIGRESGRIVGCEIDDTSSIEGRGAGDEGRT